MHPVKSLNFISVVIFVSVLFASADSPEGKCDLKNEGAFSFPQCEARVPCDTKELRVSAWSDRAHLFVQSVLWTDGVDTLNDKAEGE